MSLKVEGPGSDPSLIPQQPRHFNILNYSNSCKHSLGNDVIRILEIVTFIDWKLKKMPMFGAL